MHGAHVLAQKFTTYGVPTSPATVTSGPPPRQGSSSDGRSEPGDGSPSALGHGAMSAAARSAASNARDGVVGSDAGDVAVGSTAGSGVHAAASKTARIGIRPRRARPGVI